MSQKQWMQITVRLPDDVGRQLDELARRMDRSRAYVAREALRWYLAREIRNLAEAERLDAEEAARLLRTMGGA